MKGHVFNVKQNRVLLTFPKMEESFDNNYLSWYLCELNRSIFFRFRKFKSISRVPSVDVLIALVTSALVIAVTKFEREGFVRIS